MPFVGWPPRCLLRAATGMPCPFCGMTTGVLAVLRGDLGDAFAANPAAPLFVLAVAVALLLRAPVLASQRARVTGAARRLSRWRWSVLAGLWAFEVHRFAVR